METTPTEPVPSKLNGNISLLSTSMEIGLQVEGMVGMLFASIILYYAMDKYLSKNKKYVNIDSQIMSINVEKDKYQTNDVLTYLYKYSVIATVLYTYGGVTYSARCILNTVESEVQAHKIKKENLGKTINIWGEVNKSLNSDSEETLSLDSDNIIVTEGLAYLEKPRKNERKALILSIIAICIGGLGWFKYKYRKNDYAQTANALGFI